jgi:hypothetical protein
MPKIRRKSAAVALAVLGVAGLSLASASTLNVTSSSLQAGNATVGQCDTDGVTVGYTYGYASGEYQATGINVTGIAAGCAGGTIGVTLTAGATTSTLAAGSVTATSYSATLSTPVSAAALSEVDVVISK